MPRVACSLLSAPPRPPLLPQFRAAELEERAGEVWSQMWEGTRLPVSTALFDEAEHVWASVSIRAAYLTHRAGGLHIQWVGRCVPRGRWWEVSGCQEVFSICAELFWTWPPCIYKRGDAVLAAGYNCSVWVHPVFLQELVALVVSKGNSKCFRERWMWMCDAVTINQPLTDSHSNTFIEQALFSAPFLHLSPCPQFTTTP